METPLCFDDPAPVPFMLHSKSALRPRFILMVGDDGVLFVPYRVTGAPEPFFVPNADEKGAASALAALARHPDIPVTLFADMLAQDFRREDIPRLSPLDRPRLIRRRLQQAFPQARLTASFTLNAARTHLLMTGLHENAPVFDWLERLKPRTPHICLLPVECADMAMRLLPDAATGWALILSRQRTGGFRQIVTHKGELVFTRLTPPLPPQAAPQEIAEAVSRDIKASLGYLGRLGLSDSGQLRTMLLMPDTLHDALEKITLPVHSVTLLSPYKAARHLHLPFLPNADNSYGDLLYAGWLAQKRKPRLTLMLPDMKMARQTETIRRWGMRVAMAALLFALGATALQAGDLLAALVRNQKETAQLAELHKKLADMRTADPAGESVARLRQALERKHLFASPMPMPWAAFEALNRGLGENARLVKLDWQNDNGKTGDEVMQAQLRLTNNASLADRETTVAHFQQVAQNAAQAMPDYNVRLTRYPFPALPQETLSNSAPENAAADTTAELTIRRAAP